MHYNAVGKYDLGQVRRAWGEERGLGPPARHFLGSALLGQLFDFTLGQWLVPVSGDRLADCSGGRGLDHSMNWRVGQISGGAQRSASLCSIPPEGYLERDGRTTSTRRL